MNSADTLIPSSRLLALRLEGHWIGHNHIKNRVKPLSGTDNSVSNEGKEKKENTSFQYCQEMDCDYSYFKNRIFLRE